MLRFGIVMLLLCGHFYVSGSMSDYVLKIDGPNSAFEGEEVVFTVTLDDLPVQARVVFGNKNSMFTNASSGEVTIEMPKVAFAGEIILFEAWIAGNVSAFHEILVKNQTGALSVTLSVDAIVELQDFSVLVEANDQPVMDAEVWFNSGSIMTNQEGVVFLKAPDVLVTTNFGISVIKSGYGSYFDTIRVNEGGIGMQLMEVLGPRIVSPGMEELEYQIFGLDGSIDSINVTVLYENIEVGLYTTDEDGWVVLDAPRVINQDYFLLDLSKTEYRLLSGLNVVKVFLFEIFFDSTLSLDLIPSEVNEGEMVRAAVSDSSGDGVKDATLWIGSESSSFVTDGSGVVEFRSPSVFFDQEQYVYAVKAGYNVGEARLTIRNNPLSSPSLFIKVDSVVNASSIFSVSVVDLLNNPVSDAEVWFNGEYEVTGESGDTWLSAPVIDDSQLFMINASRDGYLPSSTMVEVFVDEGGEGTDVLVVGIVPSVLEGDRFIISVRTGQGMVVSGARVSFQDTLYYTDYTGTVEIVAPEVSWDSSVDIVVSRMGYISAKSEVLIKNLEGFPYWFILAIIIVILIVGFTVYYRNRFQF
jgi:hypothetical protein